MPSAQPAGLPGGNETYLAIPKIDFPRHPILKVKHLRPERMHKLDVPRKLGLHLKYTPLRAVFALHLELARGRVENDVEGVVFEVEFGDGAAFELGGGEGRGFGGEDDGGSGDHAWESVRVPWPATLRLLGIDKSWKRRPSCPTIRVDVPHGCDVGVRDEREAGTYA